MQDDVMKDAFRQLKCLVVDDHMMMRNLVTQHLRGIGCTSISTAVNGQDALDTLRKGKLVGDHYDVIFVDWGMPVMNGLDFMKACRPEFPHTAFVMLTGENERKKVLQAFEQGVTAYIIKPVARDTLKKILCNVMEWLEKQKLSA